MEVQQCCLKLDQKYALDDLTSSSDGTSWLRDGIGGGSAGIGSVSVLNCPVFQTWMVFLFAFCPMVPPLHCQILKLVAIPTSLCNIQT